MCVHIERERERERERETETDRERERETLSTCGPLNSCWLLSLSLSLSRAYSHDSPQSRPYFISQRCIILNPTEQHPAALHSARTRNNPPNLNPEERICSAFGHRILFEPCCAESVPKPSRISGRRWLPRPLVLGRTARSMGRRA